MEFVFHSLKQEIHKNYFSNETINEYIKNRIKANDDHCLHPFDYNVFDESGNSLFCYAIEHKIEALIDKILKASSKVDDLYLFIRYKAQEYPIHTIFRLGDFETFKKVHDANPKYFLTQLQNLQDANGNSPLEVLSNLPEAEDKNTFLDRKAGKLKIASFLAKTHPDFMSKIYHKDDFGNTKSFTEHVKSKGFDEFAVIWDAHTTNAKSL